MGLPGNYLVPMPPGPCAVAAAEQPHPGLDAAGHP